MITRVEPFANQVDSGVIAGTIGDGVQMVLWMVWD
jgi:hypothetical protein